MPGPAPKTYRLLLEAEKQNIPEIVRLKRLLKFALRSCGFKCVSLVDSKVPEQGAEQKKAPAPT